MTDQPEIAPVLPASLSDRQGFNKRWYAGDSSLAIRRPTNSAEVLAAVAELIRLPGIQPNQLQVTCGRHCYEDFVYNASTRAIIDLTGLKGYGEATVDGRAAYYLDVGMGNWDMYRLLNNVYQRTCPAGSCYSVGLGGHITGGGYGFLSRLFGLTIDYLSAVDIIVITSNGPQLIEKCSANNQPNLFWAVRGGGGGQFGVITRYYFDAATLPQAPGYMFTTTYAWNWFDQNGNLAISPSMFGSIVNSFFFGQFCNQNPSTWNIFGILHGNHMDAKTMNIVEVDIYYASSGQSLDQYRAARAERLKERARLASEIGPLSVDDCELNGHPYIPSTHRLGVQGANEGVGGPGPDQIFTYLEGMQQLNGSGPNRYGKYKSAYHTTAFTQTMLDYAYKGLTTPVYNPQTGARVDMSASLIQMDSYGGKINTVPPDATAIPQRSSIAKLQYQSYWVTNLGPGYDDPALEAAHVNWINQTYSSIYSATGGIPYGAGLQGCYYNYPDIYMGSTVPGTPPLSQALTLYFGSNLTRLQNASRTYNPYGWFRNSQSLSNLN